MLLNTGIIIEQNAITVESKDFFHPSFSSIIQMALPAHWENGSPKTSSELLRIFVVQLMPERISGQGPWETDTLVRFACRSFHGDCSWEQYIQGHEGSKMREKEKLTFYNFAAEASAYPTRELWIQDEPSQLTRIETRDQAFISTHPYYPFITYGLFPRRKHKHGEAALLSWRKFLESDSTIGHQQATLSAAGEMSISVLNEGVGRHSTVSTTRLQFFQCQQHTQFSEMILFHDILSALNGGSQKEMCKS